MRDGPSSLKPQSSRHKRIRKRKKEELTLWPLEELIASQLNSRAAIKIPEMAPSKAEEVPITRPKKPITAANMGKMTTISLMAKDMPSTDAKKPKTATDTGLMATSQIQEQPTTAPGLPKELVEQHTLIIRPQLEVGVKDVEKAIRSIESACGNVVWGSSRLRKPTGGKGPAMLEINVLYNDCSRHKTMPNACFMMRAIHRDSSSHETLRMEDVVGRVRGMTNLVAACEVVAQKSWAVNAVSGSGSACARLEPLLSKPHGRTG